jgi:hypothetical protein
MGRQPSPRVPRDRGEERSWLEPERRLVLAAWAITRALMLAAALLARPDGDVALYLRYAGRILAGEVPYLDFAMEYPPGIIPFIVAPGIFTTSLAGYRLGFALEMLLVDLLCLVLVESSLRRCAGDPRRQVMARLLYLLLPLLLFALPYRRYDLVPMAFTLACLWFWREGRSLPAWICLGLGCAAKLYPVVLLPLLVLVALGRKGSPRELMKGVAVVAATVTVAWLPLAAMAGPQVWRFLAYLQERGLEIESLYANLVVMARPFGYPVETTFSHGSIELVAAIAPALSSFSMVAGALVYSLVLHHAWRACRRPGWSDDDLPRLFLLALLGLILTGKVLSPQYLLWLVPFLALALPTLARPGLVFSLALLVFAFTVAVYPFGFAGLSMLRPWPWVLVSIRNALLVALFLLSFAPATQRRLAASVAGA